VNPYPSAPPPAPIRPTPWGARLRRSPVTFALIAATVSVYLLQILGQTALGFDLVLRLGLKDNGLILGGQLWRLVTPVFIHGGILHLGVNMYSLFALGPAVERFFGPPRFLAVYLLSGIGGVVFSLAFSPAASVGASGAIFGLLGALATFLYLHRPVFGPAGGMMLRQLVIVGALNLFASLSPGIDLWGHVGGLVTGVTCALYFGPRLVPTTVGGVPTGLSDQQPWSEVRSRVFIAALGVGAVAALAIALGLASGG
jgi:membrane associated rhomboid family serine protease